MKTRGRLLVLLLLPLACAGLLAQERAAQEPTQAPEPAAGTPARPGEDSAPPDAPDEPGPPEEEVSADNNLSFPVDI
jgi:hypothetical protein